MAWLEIENAEDDFDFPEIVTAPTILRTGADLMEGPRAETHGDMREQHEGMARLVNAYLRNKWGDLHPPLSASEASMLESLMKISRTQCGKFNLDDYVDGAAYMGIAGYLGQEG